MFARQRTHLGTAFEQYFEVVPALTKDLVKEAYRIRHSGYCEDLQFEPLQGNKFEMDEFDKYALHLLIRSIKDDAFIACSRIIRPPTDDIGWLLPFERTCAKQLDRSIIDPSKLPRNKIAEVSRLAVVADFRRRKGESSQPINLSEADYEVTQFPRFPYIPLGLYYGTLELARLKAIEVLFMLTEERLAKHLCKLGFQQKFIGAPIEHRGLRYPSMIVVNDAICNLRPIFRPLYQTIAMDIQLGLNRRF